jgi:hypothetical protein
MNDRMKTKYRHPRRKISGTYDDCAFKVSSAGVIYRHWYKLPITDELAGLPTIDFGHRYVNREPVGPAYVGPIPPAGDQTDTRRLLDEIVCYEFHGPPPCNYRAARVRHIDGNTGNCAADNLRWDVVEDFMTDLDRKRYVVAMVISDIPYKYQTSREWLARRAIGLTPTAPARPLLHVEGDEVSLWNPITQLTEVT